MARWGPIFTTVDELSQMSECVCGKTEEYFDFFMTDSEIQKIICRSCKQVYQKEMYRSQVERYSADFGTYDGCEYIDPCQDDIPDLNCRCGNNRKDLFGLFFHDDELYCDCYKCSYICKLEFNYTVNGQKLNDSELVDLSLKQCFCGNDNLDKFTIEENPQNSAMYLECKTCGNRQGLHQPGRNHVDETDQVHWESIEHGSDHEKRVKITNVNQLKRGDHIAGTTSKVLHWHHAIVEWVDYNEEKIHVIHYSTTVKEYKNPHKTTVRRNVLKLNDEYDTFHRFDYSECNDPETVIQNACSKLGEEKYWLGHNNCEHFARWCKTDDKTCYQWRQHFRKTVARPIAQHGITLGIKEGAKAGIKSLAQTGLKIGVKAATYAGEAIGAGVGVAIELLDAGVDIYQVYKKKQSGVISKGEFIDYVKNRVCKFGTRTLCTVGGALLGGLLIPVPVVGSLIGGVVGNVVHWVGSKIWDGVKRLFGKK